MDVDARVQLYDLKTKYQFQTAPGYDQYNMPLYGLQNGSDISYYPMYQGFLGPAYVNGVQVAFQTEKNGSICKFICIHTEHFTDMLNYYQDPQRLSGWDLEKSRYAIV